MCGRRVVSRNTRDTESVEFPNYRSRMGEKKEKEKYIGTRKHSRLR